MRHVPLLLAMACAVAAPAQAQRASAQLGDLSLEQLSDTRVVTVSRLEEGLDLAAASVYVITADDIRRAGVTTIPEALRLAPMLDVARADANQYAISTRGFNAVLANKMLVLIDGRTIYTPLFSGVFWEAQDVLLADVDRIEVVSGPSTALWGSNAVNGLIHVITKTAAATQGMALSVDAGTAHRGGSVRHGMRVDDAALRLYAKAYDRDGTRRADGTPVNEDANGRQAGFRADWGRDDERFTLQGDIYTGRIRASPKRSFSGGNLLARWEGTTAQGEGWTVQASLDRTTRDHPEIFGESLDTLDLVAQYSRPWGDGHQLLFGAGYRRSNDDVENSTVLAFVPPKRSMEWGRVYAQGRFAWRPDLQATVAASLESNPYTGLEVLPSVRLAWHVDASQLAWVAMSRAVRAPSRVDREYFVPAAPPYLIAGGPDFRSEVSTTLEVGWRAQHGRMASYSLTAFHHEQERQRSLAPTPNGLELRNDVEGSTQGLEAWARWRIVSNWRVDAGWVVLRQRLAARPGTEDRGGVAALGNDPSHWGSLRSSLDLSPRLSWDLQWRRVGSRPQPAVPSYAALDSRLAWRTENGAELALVVKNAADPRHVEWGVASHRAELEREFSLQLSWRH